MARPKILNKQVSICAWVKPAVKIALNDLSRQTGKSCSDLIETAILKLSSEYIINKHVEDKTELSEPSKLLTAVNVLMDNQTSFHNS